MYEMYYYVEVDVCMVRDQYKFSSFEFINGGGGGGGGGEEMY